LTYNDALKAISIVQRDIANQGTPLFTYYDGNYNGSTNALSQPINANLVRFVKINLMVLHNNQDQSQSSFSITAGASIRSIKDNLGN
jgi:hypothetical protein